MGMDPQILINFYMFICLALLAYNVGYIIRGRIRRGSAPRRIAMCYKLLSVEAQRLTQEAPSEEHRKKLRKILNSLKKLLLFHEAMLQGLSGKWEMIFRGYLNAYAQVFLEAAEEYGKRSPMERAFFAHILSVYRPDFRGGTQKISRILLEYMEHSTVYCRENVLQALYTLGNDGAIIQAMNILSQTDAYHYPRLISDGMEAYPGDKEALAWKLWGHSGGWKDYLQVAVVQFAGNQSECYAPVFLEALRDDKTPMETRYALVRYFRRHPIDQARALLLKLLKEQLHEGGLAIPAAAALEQYGGAETVAALTEAVQSRNWYVRRNAATTLVKLNCDRDTMLTLMKTNDRYAKEMLEYMREVKNAEKTEEVGV